MGQGLGGPQRPGTRSSLCHFIWGEGALNSLNVDTHSGNLNRSVGLIGGFEVKGLGLGVYQPTVLKMKVFSFGGEGEGKLPSRANFAGPLFF